VQTIEDRILQLQEDKQSLANQALGTEAAKKMNKLSVAEILCELFMMWTCVRSWHQFWLMFWILF
jgi:SNF2 family DNA or RNA helicase